MKAIEIAKAIREVFRADRTTQANVREGLQNAFERSNNRRAIKKSFTKTERGSTFNAEVNRLVIRKAVQVAFGAESIGDSLDTISGFHVGGDLHIRTHKRGHVGQVLFGKDASKKGTKNFRLKTAYMDDFMEYILLEIQLHVYSDLYFGAPKDGRGLQNSLGKGPYPGQPRLGFLGVFDDGDLFPCPLVDCIYPQSFINDQKCDCPRTCANEAAFTCDSCAGLLTQSSATAIGIALGVSLGTALGVGLGVGLGLGGGVGAYLAEGSIQLAVDSVQEFSSSPQVQGGIKQALIRLASMQIPLAAVELIWGCAANAVSSRKLRRLTEIVNLCFEIEIQGEKEGLQVCSSLDGTPLGTAEHVINEELEQTGSPGGVQVVQWSPNPNPRAKSPTSGPAPPLPSLNHGVDLGWGKNECQAMSSTPNSFMFREQSLAGCFDVLCLIRCAHSLAVTVAFLKRLSKWNRKRGKLQEHQSNSGYWRPKNRLQVAGKLDLHS